MKTCQLKVWLNNKEVNLYIFQLMKQPNNMHVVLIINIVKIHIKVKLGDKIVIINFDGDYIDEHDEMVRALAIIGSYTYTPKNLYLNFKIGQPY